MCQSPTGIPTQAGVTASAFVFLFLQAAFFVCFLFLSFWNRSISAIGINRPKGVSRQANFCCRVSCRIRSDVISRARAAWLTVRNPSSRLFLIICFSRNQKARADPFGSARAYLSAVSDFMVLNCSFQKSASQLLLAGYLGDGQNCVRYILPVRIHLAPPSSLAGWALSGQSRGIGACAALSRD